MLKRARRRIADRRNVKKRRKLAPQTWPEIHKHKLSPHAEIRIPERMRGNPSLVDIVLRLGHVFDHPEHIRPGKNGRAIYDDGEYKIVLGKREYKVIATIINNS